MSIKDWPAQERPREKLLTRGAGSLSDAELLAIFLRTGVAGQDAVSLSRSLLQQFGGLRRLLRAERKVFCAAHGLGEAKFVQLRAVLEMARRDLGADLLERHRLKHPGDARDFLVAQLRDLDHEVFAALMLDSQHRVLAFEVLAHGTIDGATVYPREVVRRALAQNAAALIFAHNHPSGIAEPSQADRILTRRLKDALALLDIRVLDHFVVGDGVPVSFAERGIL